MTPDQIQKALKKRKITQKQIAQSLNVAEMSVSRAIKFFEHGVGVSDRIFTAVADVLDKPKEKVFAKYYKLPGRRVRSKIKGNNKR